MHNSIGSRAFAKIIISGEHAVVYGQPALALSVDRYVQTSIVSAPHTKNYNFILEKFASTETFTQQQLQKLAQCQSLPQPMQLLPYALAKLIENFNIKTAIGLEIRTISTIPIGCGLGSSAALIVSLLHAVNHFFALNIKIENYLEIATNIEHIQHGRSSGVDVYLATYGGGVRFENGKMTPRTFSCAPIYYINSGKSASSTAECVTGVAQYFHNSNLASDFGTITNNLDEALQQQNLAAIKENIRANNQLLEYIGVVPKKVQKFIADIESRNGVAKICGAGAIKGDAAGIIMVITDNNIADLLIKYNYEQLKLTSNSYGVQII
jgi:mevalonate kinase